MDLWSTLVVECNVGVFDFWKLTPRIIRGFLKALERRDEKGYYQSAMVCALLAEINRDRKSRTEPFTPQDFMPQLGNKPKKPAQPWQAQLAFVEQLNKRFGGLDLRKKDESQEEVPSDGQ